MERSLPFFEKILKKVLRIIPKFYIAALIFVLILNLFTVFYIKEKGNKKYVGIYYYIWYSNRPKFVKYPPNLERYNSSNESLIRKHIKELENIGIDFILISWLPFEDKITKNLETLLKLINETTSKIKISILVEPYGVKKEDIPKILDKIYTKYYKPYKNIFFHLEGKPLVAFYDNFNKIIDNRFTIRKVFGFLEISPEWYYWDLVNIKKIFPNNFISVFPRYDDFNLYARGMRQKFIKIPYVYDLQWIGAIAQNPSIVIITSWNEFYESTNIEENAKEGNFLIEKTRHYIKMFKENNPLIKFFSIIVYPFILIVEILLKIMVLLETTISYLVFISCKFLMAL